MELIPGNRYYAVPKKEFVKLLDTSIAYDIECVEDLSVMGGRTLIRLSSTFEIDPDEWEDAKTHLEKLNAAYKRN